MLVAALLATVLVACNAAQAAPSYESERAVSRASQEQQRTITVVGQGMVRMVPDVFQVNVGADAMAESVSEAKTEVEGRTEAIIAALEQMGVNRKDIQTSHYSIHFEREPMPAAKEGAIRESQGGYRVSNMFRVMVRDVDKAGAVLDAAVEAGANQVHGVSFTVEDETRWQGQARERAMADARARADKLAGLAGVELGEVVSVSEVIGGWPTGVAMEGRVGGGGITPGELQLGTQIQVAFAIRPVP
jgi:uncharacterized protein YggE